MSVQYKEFEKLYKETQKEAKELNRFNERFLTMIGQRLLAKVKPRTPVDTGQLRGTWQIQGVFKNGGTLYIVLFNPTEYASFVELGHMNPSRTKWVQGYFMATISIAEIEREMPQRYTKALNDYFSSNKYLRFN